MSKYSDVSVRLSSPMARSHICADCSTPEPTWASINRGVLICDECCSVHRSLGRHISQVKSLKKSSWSPSLLAMVQMLSSFANNIWEHLLRDPSAAQNKHKHRKPNPRDPTYPTKAEFIRAKYHFLSFMNKHRDSEINTVEDISQQLHSSVRTSSLETSLRLLSLGADPNYYHPDRGNCPLHIAAQSGHIHQVELLIVYGADPGAFDATGQTPVDYANKEGHTDLALRLTECQFELTDRLAFFLCQRKPDHRAQQHFIIPEMADNSVDLSELAKAARRRLQGIPNKLFEDLAMDVYDEVDRRENEALWIGSQNSSDVSDKQTVPFLPVNPEFTSTRNQGRQKLARFNPREFATLIIDILSEVKRRQQGSSLPQSATITKDTAVKMAALLRKAPSQRSAPKVSSLSDDEPLYDIVADDEDYASIGDSHSLREEKMDTTDGGKDETNNSDKRNTSPTSMISFTESVASSEQSDGPIMLEEYVTLKRVMMESQTQVKQLNQTKNELKHEVTLLQNMVQKLMQENTLLRSREGTLESSPSVSNGYESTQSSLSRSQRGTRSRSMFEPRDPQKHQHWHLVGTDQKGAAVLPEQTAVPAESSATNTLGSDYDNANANAPAAESESARSSGRSDSSSQITPTNSSSSLPQAKATPPDGGGGGGITMPTQDEVVRKTEKITKKIQELLLCAQDGKHDSFTMCADKIHTAVLDMASIFPMDLIVELTTWSEKLQDMCNHVPPESSTEGVVDGAFTQQVIDCAYIIAKAAKQLVIMFE